MRLDSGWRKRRQELFFARFSNLAMALMREKSGGEPPQSRRFAQANVFKPREASGLRLL